VAHCHARSCSATTAPAPFGGSICTCAIRRQHLHLRHSEAASAPAPFGGSICTCAIRRQMRRSKHRRRPCAVLFPTAARAPHLLGSKRAAEMRTGQKLKRIADVLVYLYIYFASICIFPRTLLNVALDLLAMQRSSRILRQRMETAF
jgi:hypothetical protein